MYSETHLINRDIRDLKNLLAELIRLNIPPSTNPVIPHLEMLTQLVQNSITQQAAHHTNTIQKLNQLITTNTENTTNDTTNNTELLAKLEEIKASNTDTNVIAALDNLNDDIKKIIPDSYISINEQIAIIGFAKEKFYNFKTDFAHPDFVPTVNGSSLTIKNNYGEVALDAENFQLINNGTNYITKYNSLNAGDPSGQPHMNLVLDSAFVLFMVVKKTNNFQSNPGFSTLFNSTALNLNIVLEHTNFITITNSAVDVMITNFTSSNNRSYSLYRFEVTNTGDFTLHINGIERITHNVGIPTAPVPIRLFSTAAGSFTGGLDVLHVSSPDPSFVNYSETEYVDCLKQLYLPYE